MSKTKLVDDCKETYNQYHLRKEVTNRSWVIIDLLKKIN